MKDQSPLGRLRLAIVGGLLAAGLIGCTPATDGQQIQSDQFALRGMVANNQQQLDAVQEKMQRLEDRVSELEHNGPVAGGGSNKLASIEQRVSKLETQSDTAQNAGPTAAGASVNPDSANPESANPASAKPASNETGTPAAGAAEGPDNGEEGGAAGTAANPASSSSASSTVAVGAPSWRTMLDQELSASHDDPGEQLYRQGLVDLKANQYPQALNHFQTLQRKYPKSSLSEPAEFFAANALDEMGKYDQAILQYNDQTMRFPKGRFASAALLREAQAFMKINDRIDARLTLQKLLSDLPESPEAPMAKSMMQTLAS